MMRKLFYIFLILNVFFIFGCNSQNKNEEPIEPVDNSYFELKGGSLNEDVYSINVANAINSISLSNYYETNIKNLKIYAEDVEITEQAVELLEGNNNFTITADSVSYKINIYRNKMFSFNIVDLDGYPIAKIYYEENTEIDNEKLISLHPEVEGYNWISYQNLDQVLTGESNKLISNFEKIEYSIVFVINGERITKKIHNGDLIEYPDIPVVDEYEFTGWTLVNEPFTDEVYNYYKSIGIVANYKKVSLDLTYELYGGTTSYAVEDVNGKIKFGTATKAGYLFKGWYLDPYFKTEVSDYLYANYQGETFYAKFELDNANLIATAYYSLRNSQDTDYDDISLYDYGISPMASLYWYKIAIKEELGQYFVTAIAKSGAKISTLGEYAYLMLGYGACPFYSDFISLLVEVGNEVVFAVSPDGQDNGAFYNIVSFIPSTGVSKLNDVKSYLENKYSSINSTNKDLSLVDAYNEFTITWESNKEDIISNTGKYVQPLRSQSVTLTAYCEGKKVYSFIVGVEGSSKSSYLSAGYIYSSYASLTQNAMDKLDIIYPSFLEIDENGDFTNLSKVQSNIKTYILPKALKSGTKIVISVNQDSSGDFDAVATNPTNLTKLVTNLVKVVKDLGVDGIDIDWETPTTAGKTHFTVLMKELYTALKAANPNYLVTAAIGGGMWAPPKYDLDNSKNYMDYINMMTYSMCSSSGYYQNALYPSTKGATLTSCSIKESVDIYHKYGIPNSMIIVGVAFYATCQTGCSGPGTKTGNGTSVSRSAMYRNNPLSDTCKDYYDEECCVPYRYDSVNKVFYSFDSDQSIKDKSLYIKENGLAGMMFWQYSQAIDDDLVNLMYKYLKD